MIDPNSDDKSLNQKNQSIVRSNEIDTNYESMSQMRPIGCDVNESHYFVPIEGYEVMERRNRFTVFRLRVEDLLNDHKWLVYRRYTDFVRLNQQLIKLFPNYRFSLPSKKWFGDNFDPIFLEDRQLGLQVFLNNIICLKSVTDSKPVREFLCLDEPKDDTIDFERSHSSTDCSEESTRSLKSLLKSKDLEIDLLKKEINQLRFQIKSQKYINNTEDNNETQIDDQLPKLDMRVRDSPDGTSNPSSDSTQH